MKPPSSKLPARSGRSNGKNHRIGEGKRKSAAALALERTQGRQAAFLAAFANEGTVRVACLMTGVGIGRKSARAIRGKVSNGRS